MKSLLRHIELPAAKSKPARQRRSAPAHSSLLQIEPRMLFDGAAAVIASATDAPVDERVHMDPVAEDVADLGTLHAPAVLVAQQPARELVVMDASLPDRALLERGLLANTDLLVIGADTDGLAQIASALSGNTMYSAVHIISHGQSDGRLVLGSRVLDVNNLTRYSSELAEIGSHMSADADLLLYGCRIAEGRDGMHFLQALAQATSADVAASVNDTGATARQADWLLEARTGTIEAHVPFDAATLESWSHVLPAAPTVSLSLAQGSSILLGESFTLTAAFNNPGSTAGFGPYVDLFVPARGADGGASPDGVTISSASYLGSAITPTIITLTPADIASGKVSHPFFMSSAGSPLVSIPVGMQAGDQLVVLQLPFGSFTPGQPPAEISITGTMSPLADVGTPLAIIARGGLQYGNDALDNPASDPSVEGSATSIVADPALYRLRTTYLGPEDETATGPNYLRAYRIDVDVASGQTLSALQISSMLSDGMQYVPIVGVPADIGGTALGSAPPGGWVNVNGVLLSAAGTSVVTPSTLTPGGSATRELTSVTGGASTSDAAMIVQFYVPQANASAAPIIDAASGNAVTLTSGTALAANWTPTDLRDSMLPVSESVASAHALTARSIATQKTGVIGNDVGATGFSPGDRVDYTLEAQISDYFAFGGDASGTDLTVVDTLSDGQMFLDSTTSPAGADPSLQIRRNNTTESYTLTRGANYTVSLDAQGRQIVVFNLRSALPGGAGQVLVGDLFADAIGQGATTAQIRFSTQLLDNYRIAPVDSAGNSVAGSTQLALNEGDFVANREQAEGLVLDTALDPTIPGLLSEIDSSGVVFGVAGNPVSITLTGINGAPPGAPARISPGDDVSYRLLYTLPTGDFENLRLTAYIPLPIFLAGDPDADGTANGFANQPGGYTSTPTVGQFSVRAIGGDGTGVSLPVLNVDTTTNSLQFDLGSRADNSNQPLTIEISYTLRASDDPFADGLLLTTQAGATSSSTAMSPIASNAITQVVLGEPDVDVHKGVIADDVVRATSSFDPVYSPVNPLPLVRPAGDTSANPLLGVVSSAAAVNLDSNISAVDGNDQVRFAIVLTNNGSSSRGAFDVRISDVLPANIDPASLANLRVVRGDGTPVSYERVGGGAATVNDLFGVGIELVDTPSAGPAPALGALQGTLDPAGNPSVPGANVIIVTYDARVLTSAPVSTSAASGATLFNYAGSEGGTDFTAADLSDSASVTTAPLSINKRIVATDRSYTSLVGGYEEVVVGEILTYEVTLTVPEGLTQNAVFVDTLDTRMSFVELVGATAGSGLSTSNALSGFTAIVPTSVSGGEANRVSFNFGTITNSNTNNAQTEVITLTYRVVVGNVAGTQSGSTLQNQADLNSDAGTVTGSAPHATAVEPNVTATLLPSTTVADAGDTVTFTLTLQSNGGVPAFDVGLADLLPAGLSYVAGSLAQSSGPAATALSFSGASLAGVWSQIDPGTPVVLTFQATVDNTVAMGQGLAQTASIEWSSIPGNANNLSPFATVGDRERLGSGGVDDYTGTAGATVTVAASIPELIRVQTSEPTTAGATVAVGEIVRYRMVVAIPEANATDFRLNPQLPASMRFLNDGTATVAFVGADGGAGISSSALSGAGLVQTGGGSVAADIAGLPALFVVPSAAIVDGSGTPIGSGPMAAGAEPVFRLGNLVNADSDGNREFVVVEFNAVVDNSAVVASGSTLPVRFGYESGGVLRGTTPDDVVSVAEPAITAIDKRVVSVVGGVVTYEVVFTNSGTTAAHDVQLTDAFAGAVNQTFSGPGGVTIVSAPPGTVNASTGTDLDVRISQLDAGGNVTIRYTAVVLDNTQLVPARNASLVYSSLTDGVGGGSTLTVTTTAGAVLSSTTGERTGNTGDYGGTQNSYRQQDAAGLGVISGRLWDDTINYNGVWDGGAADTGLSGVNITLTWAGLDGAFGTGDDQSFSATSAADGSYSSGALPAGNYRITAPVSLTQAGLGAVSVYRDAGGAPLNDGVIALTLADSAAVAGRDFLYVQQNDAPGVTVGGARTIVEDTATAFTGADLISIGDPDAGSATTMQVSLGVLQGWINVTAAGGALVSGNGTGSVSLSGSVAAINSTLATLTYQANPNYNGADVLTVSVADRGNTGDADGDGVPNEALDDNLTQTRTVALTVTAVNDPPVALADLRSTSEDAPITGQLMSPNLAQQAAGDVSDTDPDLVYGDALLVQGLSAGNVGGVLSGGVGSPITGTWGSLLVAADGSYSYTPAPAAQALALGATATDVFTYTIRDSAGATSTNTLTITLTGNNDLVSAQPDTRVTFEDDPPLTGNVMAGNGVAGGQPGDVADSDPDGDALTLQGVQAGSTAALLSSGIGATITGDYGALVLQSNGSYVYSQDGRAQNLAAGQVVSDVFSYTITDSQGSTTTTTLTIVISGRNDPPLASNDARMTSEDQAVSGQLVAPSVAQQGAGDVTDTDLDLGNGDVIGVVGVAPGVLSGPLTGGVASAISGSYGQLVLQADGSYSYQPGAAAQSLPVGAVATDVFSYTIADTLGATSSARLTITINGMNDAPQARADGNSVLTDATAPAAGNVLTAGAATDVADVDADSGSTLVVQGVVAGTSAAPVSGGLSIPVAGDHGSLVLAADGTYAYTLNSASPGVLAMLPGQVLTDVFTYSINDGNGGVATTTLTITIQGVFDPPQGDDSVFVINEDEDFVLMPSDFGFTDPDAGDAFSAVRIDTLPASGQLLLNGSPVLPGQVVPFAQLSSLIYRPATDANSQNLQSMPTIGFSVRDSSGLFDPTPNSLGLLIDPVNDPPVAPSISVTVDGGAVLASPLSAIVGLAAVSDPDRPQQTLLVTVDSIPNTAAGTFYRPDGTALIAGASLSPQELQTLRFVPNPANPAAPLTGNGLIDAGQLVYTVRDALGASASGIVAVTVRPVPPATGPSGMPRAEASVASLFAPLPFAAAALGDGSAAGPRTSDASYRAQVPVSDAVRGEAFGEYVRRAVADSRDGIAAADLRLSPLREAGDFGTFMPWSQDPIKLAMTKNAAQEVSAQKGDVAAPAQAMNGANMVKADDCSAEDKPKVKSKVKPKVVKSAGLWRDGSASAPGPTNFSEQLKETRKPFRTLIKPTVAPAAGRQC